MKRWLLIAALCCLACNPVPPRPTPIPIPPSTTQPPAAMTALRVSGTKFVNDSGPVSWIGCHACCSDSSKTTDGWPWASESFMRACAEHKGAFVELRNGPNQGSEPPTTLYDGDSTRYGFDGYVKTSNGKYDLTKFDAPYWDHFNKSITLAEKMGLYVGVDVVDRWVLRRGLSVWAPDKNVQGAEYNDPTICQKTPKNWHAAWIKKVAQEAGQHVNVVFLTGNEGFLPAGACLKPWEEGMADIIRQTEKDRGYVRHLIGSNCQVPDIERSPKIDFVIVHSKTALPPRWGKPLVSNENGDTQNAAQWAAEARKARALGSSYSLWRGGMSDAEYAVALNELVKIQEGQ